MDKTRKIVTSALFAALIFIATLFFTVKLPNGYANLGDCFIIIAACLMGAKYGAAASAIGAALADIMLGYQSYAPATFVIKALMAVIAALIYTSLGNRSKLLAVFSASLLAEAFMALGYFAFECFLYGFGAALLSVFGNAMQGIVNIVAALLIMAVMTKNKYIVTYFNNLGKK